MHFFERVAKNFLRLRVVHEVVLIGPRPEHVGVIQDIQKRRATGRVLRRRRIDVHNALLGFFNAGQLTADLVVTDELDANLAIGPLFEVTRELKTSGAFDQKVLLVKARGAELQAVLDAAEASDEDGGRRITL